MSIFFQILKYEARAAAVVADKEATGKNPAIAPVALREPMLAADMSAVSDKPFDEPLLATDSRLSTIIRASPGRP